MKSVCLLGVIGVLGLGLLSGCAANESEAASPLPVADLAGKFVFEPQIGTTFEHRMTRLEEVQLVGAPLNQHEEWDATWSMSITPETNLFLYRAELKNLRIAINGAEVLKGPEIADKGAFMELLFDHDGKIVDVRRTETITNALLSVTAPENQQQIAAMFAPDSLRQLFATRANERSADLIGQSAAIGSTWGGVVRAPDGSTPLAKKLSVTADEPCGDARCVRVVRDTFVDEGIVWQQAEARVKAQVAQSAGDASQVELIKAELKLEDELVVDPRTMEFHGARFDQVATMTISTPKGEMSVIYRTLRESTYKY